MLPGTTGVPEGWQSAPQLVVVRVWVCGGAAACVVLVVLVVVLEAGAGGGGAGVVVDEELVGVVDVKVCDADVVVVDDEVETVAVAGNGAVGLVAVVEVPVLAVVDAWLPQPAARRTSVSAAATRVRLQAM